MAKSGDNRSNVDRQPAIPPQQAGGQQVMDLLDEIHKLEQFRREQLTLRKLGSYLMSSFAAREAYAAIECFGPQLWPAATGAVYLLNGSADYLERVATWGDAALNKQPLALQDCWALRLLQPHCNRDAGLEPLCGHIEASGTLPSLCVPLAAQGQTLGLLHLQCLKNN